MFSKPAYRPYWIRLGIIMLASVLVVAVSNEIFFQAQKDASDRGPQVVELVIPAGTARRVAAGGSEPSIPDRMVFVVGDILRVKNQDQAPHQLGPLWVPAGASASLVMGQAANYSYSCDFRSDRYLGIDVRPPTTWMTRIAGLIVAAPTLGALIFLYSILAFPVQVVGPTKEGIG